MKQRTKNRVLNFSGMQFGKLAAEILAQIMALDPDFYALDISKNALASEGLSAIIQALSKNTTVISLDVANNNVDESGFSALFAHLCSSQYIISLNISS